LYPGQEQKLNIMDKNWMTNGKFGMIQIYIWIMLIVVRQPCRKLLRQKNMAAPTQESFLEKLKQALVLVESLRSENDTLKDNFEKVWRLLTRDIRQICCNSSEKRNYSKRYKCSHQWKGLKLL
jgi:hypothetical protein